jgi:hypothetical protein
MGWGGQWRGTHAVASTAATSWNACRGCERTATPQHAFPPGSDQVLLTYLLEHPELSHLVSLQGSSCRPQAHRVWDLQEGRRGGGEGTQGTHPSAAGHACNLLQVRLVPALSQPTDQLLRSEVLCIAPLHILWPWHPLYCVPVPPHVQAQPWRCPWTAWRTCGMPPATRPQTWGTAHRPAQQQMDAGDSRTSRVA